MTPNNQAELVMMDAGGLVEPTVTKTQCPACPAAYMQKTYDVELPKTVLS